MWPATQLNPLSKARGRTCNLMVPNGIGFHCTTTGTPRRFFCLFVCLFGGGAAPEVAYGSSQPRGWIEAVAAGLHHSHSNARSKPVCDLHHNSWQHQILNPLSEARDQTCILMDVSQVHYYCATTGTPPKSFEDQFPPTPRTYLGTRSELKWAFVLF